MNNKICCTFSILCLLSKFAFMGVLVGISVGEKNILNAQEVDKGLIGVWEAEKAFNRYQTRTVTLRKLKNHWTATVDDTIYKVANQSGKISFKLPDRGGKFRGVIAEDGQSIAGFWIQPITSNLNYPLATPVRFEKVREGWRAELQPFRDRMRLYLVASKPLENLSKHLSETRNAISEYESATFL